MLYQWDDRKAATNLRKHGIDFADSVAVFEDELALMLVDDHPDEERYIAIGQDVLRRVLVVVFVYREERTIRIISARRATAKERREYEGGQ
jgi:uncharacterized DUF497 family protein